MDVTTKTWRRYGRRRRQEEKEDLKDKVKYHVPSPFHRSFQSLVFLPPVVAKTLLFIRVARAIKIIAARVDPRDAGNQMAFDLAKVRQENATGFQDRGP